MYLTKRSLQQGFTLIELMVVIGIIAVLAVAGLAAINVAQKSARDSRRTNDMREAATMLQQYYVANGFYPSSGAWIAADATGTNYTAVKALLLTSAGGSLTLPTPQNAANYPYSYSSDSTTSSLKYCLCAKLEGLTASAKNDGAGASGACSIVAATDPADSYLCIAVR